MNEQQLLHAVSKVVVQQKNKMLEQLLHEIADDSEGPMQKRLLEYERLANATASRQYNKISRRFSDLSDELRDTIRTTLEEIKASMTHIVRVEQPDDLPDIEIEDAHMNLHRVVRKAEQGIHTAMVGPAGTGKGKAAQMVAEALSLPFFAKSCSITDTKGDWIGYMDAGGTYRSSPFREAYENGGVMFIDEGDAANPQVFVLINAGLSDGRMAFPDGMVTQHKDFRVLMAANTWGRGADRQYRGRAIQDAASLNRFAKVFWDYDYALERKIAPNQSWCDYVQAVRTIVLDHKMKYVVSYRQTLNGGRELNAGAPLHEVATDHIFADWDADDLEKLNSLIRSTDVADMHKEIWKEMRL